MIFNDSYNNIEINDVINLLYVDPPYNINNKWFDNSTDSYSSFLRNVFDYYDAKLSDNGSIWLFNEWQNSKTIMNLCEEFKYHIIMPIIWFRSSPGKAGQRYKMNYEMIWWIVKNKNDYVFNKQFIKIQGKEVLPYFKQNGEPMGWRYEGNERVKDAEIGSVWIYPEDKMPKVLESTGKRNRVEQIKDVWADTRPFWSMPENTSHVCQKPQSLIERILKTSTDEKDLVVDPFGGTFSCGRMCKLLHRKYIGIELNKDFYTEGKQFIKDGKGLKSIRN